MLIALIIAIFGALIYGFAGNPKAQQLGFVMYAVGLFWCVALIARSGGIALHLP